MKEDKEEYALIMKLLPPKKGDSVLDMGCGNGELGSFIVSTTGAKVTFSDPNNYPKLAGKDFVQCGMGKTPFADNSFDKIYSLLVVSHVEDVDAGLKEMHRISRGQILLTTTNQYVVWFYKLAHFLGFTPPLTYAHAFKLYNKGSFKKLLERNGWKVKHFCYEGNYATKKLPFNFLKTRLMIIASK